MAPGAAGLAAGDEGRGRRPRRVSGDDRQRRILATAEEMLATHSLAEVSVDGLARGAGISRPTFYFYYPSKEAVVLSLLDRVVEEARTSRRYVLARLGAAEEPHRLWRQALEAIHDTFSAHRPVVLAAAGMMMDSDEARRLWSGVMQGFVDDTAAAIEHERARGAAPAGPAAEDLATALNWMNERVFYAGFAGLEPSLDPGRVLDVLASVWMRSVYLADDPSC